MGNNFNYIKKRKAKFILKNAIEGIAVSPSGSIEVKFNQEGRTYLFSIHGQFPSKEMVKEETYSLSLESVEHLAKEQLKLVEFPSFEQKSYSCLWSGRDLCNE